LSIPTDEFFFPRLIIQIVVSVFAGHDKIKKMTKSYLHEIFFFSCRLAYFRFAFVGQRISFFLSM